MHNIPSIPTSWINHTDIVIREGCHPSCKVLRPWNNITPYVVHNAVAIDGVWSYENGTYCFTLEEAEKVFA